MVGIFRAFVALCACLIVWSHASALCVGGGIQNLPRYVGNTDKTSPTYDSKCTDNDIQSAINNTVCPNTPIYITGEHTYTSQALNIQGKWLSLIGSANSCGVPAATSTVPVITLRGTSGGSVITIGGSSDVTLQNLEVTGGGNDNNHDSEGGGIFFGGSGSLTLQSTTVDHNQADYGGGIDVSPTGSTTLTLQTNTQILNNTAGTSGGGIRIEGQTRLFMLTDASTVSFNDAVFGYGGGIEILGPARADIASSGDVFVGAISENTATDGGGLAIIGVSAGTATARLFSTNATTPVEISSNSASGQGGGVYIQGDGNDNTFAFLCAQDFRIDNNSSPDGAALFATGSAAGQGASAAVDTGVQLNTGEQCGPESTASLGAVACPANTACNEFIGNESVDSHGDPSNGSAISMSGYQYFEANRVALRQNTGTQIVNLLDGLESFMQNCLIADNQAASQVIHSEQVFHLFRLDDCTIANNSITDGFVIFAKSGLSLSHDLFAQPDNSTLDYQQGNTSLDPDCSSFPLCLFEQYIVTSEIASMLDPDFSLQSSTPLFVDATNADVSKRNYHLQAFVQNGVVTASPAVDFAAAISEGNDLDNNPRNQDIPFVVNHFGASDVGAYELQPIADRVFTDGFGDPTSLTH